MSEPSTGPAPPLYSPTSSQLVHRGLCKLHFSECSRKCNGTTVAGKNCGSGGTVVRLGCLPTCRKHVDQASSLPAGHCQAIEACGQPCARLAPFDPPFHLCAVHEKGTDTLPCYMLTLPTEIRLEIYRYVFPVSVPPKQSRGNEECLTTLLRVNKQIGAEAASVLFGEVPFEIKLEGCRVHVCNRVYDFRLMIGKEPSSTGPVWSRSTIPGVVEKIQKFCLTTDFNTKESHVPYGIGHPVQEYISVEDYHILELRDSLRKLVKTIHPNVVRTSIRSLDVFLNDMNECAWGPDETVAAISLITEPLKGLGPVQHSVLHTPDFRLEAQQPHAVQRWRDRGVDTAAFEAEYEGYQTEWQDAMMQSPKNGTYVCPDGWEYRMNMANEDMRKIEHFISVIIHKRLGSWSPDERPFDGIPRVLHLARLACEQYDTASLTLIRDALKRRWIQYQRVTQQEQARMANLLIDMGTTMEAIHIAREYSDEFFFTKKKPLPSRLAFDFRWASLRLEDFEGMRFAGVTNVWDDRQRRYFYSSNYAVARLKTPRFVRSQRGSS